MDARTLRLEGELTIYTAQEVRQRLSQALAADAEPEPLCVDLSGVTELDTAGVQLLLAAHARAQAQQRELRLAGLAEPLREVIALLGLDSTLAPVMAAGHDMEIGPAA
ncbi:STAS domain-containing protein [Achromobacter aloeverae]|uniref:Anti-sigma B factor antagonist n=1 Tax=Achromobacter aloeverae TaxID=1750518 RepID=A0A4Q1HF24_9BURK|nr:STAS domain-containing protein [Achromobacter aloeverae]RXN84449.1 anti-sigma B factor antagonist [Achromobacter aloeverae]